MISIVDVINDLLNTLLTNQDYAYIMSLADLNNMLSSLDLNSLTFGGYLGLITTNPQIIYTFIFYMFMVMVIFTILSLPIKLIYNLLPLGLRKSFKNLRRKE